MKRTLLVLVMMLCVLTSCAEQENNTQSPDKSHESYESYEFKLSSLPDIGTFSGNQVKNYFNGEVTTEFVPRDDYGTLVPFVCGKKEYFPDFEMSYHNKYNLYGLCTTDGRIVMDKNPNFERIVYDETDDGFSYYVVYEALPEDIASYDSSPAHIIPSDGSWMISFENTYFSVDAGDGVIVAKCGYSDDTTVFFYDYEGNLINKIEDYAVFIDYTEGLALVGDSDNEYERSYFFVNKEGERIIGPFKNSYPFNAHGVTYLTDFDDETYLVDKLGKRLAEKSYRSISVSYSTDGTKCAFVALRDDEPNKADLYNENGEFLATLTGEESVIYGAELFFPSDGDILYTMGNDWRNNWKRLSDGSEFCSEEFGVMPNYIYYDMFTSDDFYFYHDDITGFGVVFDKDGQTVVSDGQMFSVESINPDINTVIYTTGIIDYSKDIDTTISHIYDYKDKKDIYTATDSDTQIYFADDNKEYAVIYDDEAHLLDLKTQKYVFENVDDVSVQIIDGKTYFNVVRNNVYTLYDADKNVLVRCVYE